MNDFEKTYFYPSDTDEIREQISQLFRMRYPVQRPSEHQVKIWDVNYYPRRGTITLDPSTRHSQKGFEALLTILEAKKNIKNAKTLGL